MSDHAQQQSPRAEYVYDEWMAEQGVPIYRGHFVPDMRTVELGHWKERGHDAAFVQLTGQQGVSEARISEIPAGVTLDPVKLGVDEMVYVVCGHGSTRVWPHGGKPEDGQTFEWSDKALFLIPPNYHAEHSNLSGDQPVRMLHYTYLPLAMSVVTDPDFFLNSNHTPKLSLADLRSAYSGAKEIGGGQGLRWITAKFNDAPYWYGNFFPDMHAWDKLEVNKGRGGRTVRIQFAGSDMSCHMSMFDSRTYKKAHRHGPGRVIVIPSGDGYSTLWIGGDPEPIVVPWQQDALFVPPEQWFHQHFNLGLEPARYLALHPPMQFGGYAERAEDRKRDTIEIYDEALSVRERFEAELAKRGLTTHMSDEAYQSPVA
jgi:hypothetical protein